MPAEVAELADPPTSLDSLETSSSTDASPSLPENLFDPRSVVASVLDDLAAADLGWMKRRNAFAECGTRWLLLASKTESNTFRLTTASCRDRLCPRCGASRGRDLADALAHHLKGQTWRMVTLTLGGDRRELKSTIRRLYDGFKRLRQSLLWRSKVAGGIAIMEVTYSDKLKEWHPHLHVLCAGVFVPQAALSAAWLAATLDSTIVHVTLVRSHSGMQRYLTKYLGKPLPDALLTRPALVKELALALAGVRQVIAFGRCHGCTRLNTPTESAWRFVGPVDRLLLGSALDDDAKRALRLALDVAMDDGNDFDFGLGPDPPEPLTPAFDRPHFVTRSFACWA